MRAWRFKKNGPGLIRPAHRPHIELSGRVVRGWVSLTRLQIPGGHKRSRTNASRRCLCRSGCERGLGGLQRRAHDSPLLVPAWRYGIRAGLGPQPTRGGGRPAARGQQQSPRRCVLDVSTRSLIPASQFVDQRVEDRSCRDVERRYPPFFLTARFGPPMPGPRSNGDVCAAGLGFSALGFLFSRLLLWWPRAIASLLHVEEHAPAPESSSLRGLRGAKMFSRDPGARAVFFAAPAAGTGASPRADGDAHCKS
jgi:hypothetical protein